MLDFFLTVVKANFKLFVFLALILVIFLLILLRFIWRKRWLIYYGSKIPGPFGVPLIGSLHLLKEGPTGMYNLLHKLLRDYPTVMKFWMGPNLYVSTTDANHLKILLTTFLDKGSFYHLLSEYFHGALAAAPVDVWRKNRKSINPTFNVSLLNSFVGPFAKHAKILCKNLEKHCDKKSDIFRTMWRCTLEAGCETLADVDPSSINSEKYMDYCARIEEILLQRLFHPLLHLDPFWNLTPLKKEVLNLWKKNCSYIQTLINLRQPSKSDEVKTTDSEENISKRRFLEQLLHMAANEEISQDHVLAEAQILLILGTETSGLVLSAVFLVLGLYPEVQKKLEEELSLILGDDDRVPTLEDINRLDYLERVIKETLRLLPPFPFTMRGVDTNIQLGSYVYPAGALAIIPISAVHRNPEYYPDPLKFDPNRFLPEEIEKRPVCSFIPFSYGIRNCIGYKYGMLSMKVILSIVLRKYRVKSCDYKSLEEIDFVVHVVGKPKNGFQVELQRK